VTLLLQELVFRYEMARLVVAPNTNVAKAAVDGMIVY
jgi:hypothetical protein